MSLDTPEIVKEQLFPREELLWWGRPKAAALLAPYDAVLIPVSLLWCAIAFHWESAGLGIFGEARATRLFLFAGLPLSLLGVYLVLGRYLFKAFKKRRTWYAVTNLRVFALEDVFRKRVSSGFLKTLSGVSRIKGPGSTASLVFGPIHFPAALIINSGLDLFPKAGEAMVSFYDLEDPDPVEALIRRHLKGGV